MHHLKQLVVSFRATDADKPEKKSEKRRKEKKKERLEEEAEEEAGEEVEGGWEKVKGGAPMVKVKENSLAKGLPLSPDKLCFRMHF